VRANTVRDHIREDSVGHTSAAEPGLEQHTSAVTAADAASAEVAVADAPGLVGEWRPVVDWPVVGVHVALLDNGKVLGYDSVGDGATETYPVHDHTRATVWDPHTGTHTQVDVDTGSNVFCSGLAHLADGSLFVAGGNKNAQLEGIAQTHVFSSAAEAWTLGQPMSFERWYPSVTPLRDGKLLITAGGPDTPEVRDTDGVLRPLNTASLKLPLYPWLDVAPDGQAFYSGPDQTMRSLDPAGGGSWQSFGERDSLDRDYGSHAMYDVGKILVAGGSSSSRDAQVIDLNGSVPQVSATAPMAFGRRQHNLTVLADGAVLATGGNSSGASLVDLNNGVYAAEVWNPATEEWQTMAAMQVTRQYHSTALLLPDGRVLSAGGGICGTCDEVGYLAKNAEVFTPPYLFKKDGSGELAARPEITSVPTEIPYNVPFAISTPNPAAIAKVALVRLGAVTHSVNMEQRYVPLASTAGSAAVNANSPANANIAPPGIYMLFIIGTDGVPSTAKMVQIAGENRPPTAAATGTPISGVAPLTVHFDATGSSDADLGDSLTFSWDLDGDGIYGDSGSAKPAFTFRSSGTHIVRLRVTDGWGASDTATVAIDVGENAQCGGPIPSLVVVIPCAGQIPSQPRGTDTLNPTVSRFAFVPDSFRVASRADAGGGRATQLPRPAAPGGSRVRFRLSEPARARILIARARLGMNVGRRCKPAARRLRTRQVCTSFTRAGAIVGGARPAGQNTLPFSGRIGRRPLPAGRYRATIIAYDNAGNRSAPRRTRFAIVRR
jgi:Galactose oxidase-like, Early set domain/PKD domain